MRYFRVKAAADELGIGRSTLYLLLGNHELTYIKVRGRTLIAEADLDDYVRRRRVLSDAALIDEHQKKGHPALQRSVSKPLGADANQLLGKEYDCTRVQSRRGAETVVEGHQR